MSGDAAKEHTSTVPENLNCTHASSNNDVFGGTNELICNVILVPQTLSFLEKAQIRLAELNRFRVPRCQRLSQAKPHATHRPL